MDERERWKWGVLVLLAPGLAMSAGLAWWMYLNIGLLSFLLDVLATCAAVALIGKMWVGVYWSWRGPRPIYERTDKPLRALVDKRGQVEVLPLPLYPASLTSLTYHNDPRINAPQVPAIAAPVVEALPTLPKAEPFYRLWEQIYPGHLILGYNADGLIAGDISDLLSTAIVGRPGTGKTTALRLVCAQVLKIGGQPMLIDPHGSIADEVSDALECAEDSSDMQRFAERLEQELDRRLAARRAGQPDGKPILVLADEWPAISQMAPDLVRVIGRIVLEGRKVLMYALISGQGLPSDLLGGTLVRDALSSRYVFNTTPAQARMAGVENETAKLLMARLDTAGPGYAILASARRRAEIVAIPNTTISDIRALLGEMPPMPMKVDRVCVQEEEPEMPLKATPASTHTLTHKAAQVTPEQRQYILEQTAAGKSPSAIAVMLWNDAHKNVVVRQVLEEEQEDA